MPRHLRVSQESSTVSLPAGATVADARRQLVLRTFASTGGDHQRTARIVGLSPEEVRAELGAMLAGKNGADSSRAPASGNSTGAGAADKIVKKQAKPKAKAKSTKRR
jgi:hypothetical protein